MNHHCRTIHVPKHNQHLSESALQFVEELKRLFSKCKFEEYLEQALRDHFVCGVYNGGIQKQLLQESDITFQHAVEIAQSIEPTE